MTPQRIDGDTIGGILENQPRNTDRFRMGDVVITSRDRVSDWAYVLPDEEPVGMILEQAIAEVRANPAAADGE